MTREEYEIRKIEEKRRAFFEAVAPIVKYKAHIYSIAMPTITVYPDGRTETVYPQWVMDACAKLDELIELVAKQFGDKHEQG
jgi:hypothetical protein